VTSLPADALTHLLVQVALLLAAAAVGGLAARTLHQPAVIGYVLAGVVLGPSVAGRLDAGAWAWLCPSDGPGAGALPALATLGAVFLLASAGLELDPAVLRERGRKLPGLLFGALVPAMAFGFALGWVLPAGFVGGSTSRLGFALLMAIALGISSPPVMSAVLRDLKLAHRSFAHVALSTAMFTDVVGWVLLGVVVAGATGAGGALGKAFAGLALLGLLAGAGWWALGRWGHRIEPDARVVVAVGVIAALAALSNGFGIEAVLGAFVAGIVLRRLGDGGAEVGAALQPVATGFLGPVFFAVAGLKVDVAQLGSVPVLGWTLVLAAAATVAKVVGSGVPWRLAGRPKSESLAVGAILNVRGSLEIVLAGVGLAAGILTSASYTSVIVVALVMSSLAAPLIRVAFGEEGLARRQQPKTGDEPAGDDEPAAPVPV